MSESSARSFGAAPPSVLGAADLITLACLRDEAAHRKDLLEPAIRGVRAWDRLVDSWEGQGLLPLIIHRLDQRGLIDGIPQAAAERMRAIDEQYAWMSRVYAEETVSFVETLLDAGIRCCVLKDPRGFPTFHSRPSYDLDLLVAPEDVEGARERLASLGMRSEVSPYRSALVDKVFGMDRVRDGLKIAVDVHWNILGGYMPRASLISVERLFERATTAPVAGTQLPVLGLVDHLVNTSIHSVTHEHRWPSRLITYLDTAEAVRACAEEVDWADLVETARSWDALTDAQLGLGMARTVLGAPVPPEVIEAVRPGYTTLGLEASTFGYLGYVWKSVDKVLGAYGPAGAGQIVSYADTLLPAARRAADAGRAVAELVAEAGGRTAVTTFGEAGTLVPDPGLSAFGRVDMLCGPISREQVSQGLHLLGFRTAADGVGVKRLEDAEVRVTLAADDEGVPSRLNPLVSTAVYIRRVWSRPQPRGSRVLDIRVVPGTPAQQLAYVLSRYAELRAIDPPGILSVTGLVDLVEPAELERIRQAASPTGRIVLELVLASRSDADFEGWLWSTHDTPTVLDALDRRTSALEELTKFLATPAGTNLTLVLCGGSRVRRLIRILVATLRHPADLSSQASAVRRGLTQAGTSRRVPPRIYLSPSGDSLVGLFGAAETPAPTGGGAGL